jgi:hypothetical protein
MELERVRSNLDPCELSTSEAEALIGGLLGVYIFGELLKMMEWLAVAWICSITYAERKTPE